MMKDQFHIDTKGFCLLCLQYVHSPVRFCPYEDQTNYQNEANLSSQSFKMLMRYLKINMFQLCNFNLTSSLLHSIASEDALENSTVMVSLCQDCSVETNKFNKLFNEWEMIQFRMDECLQTIYHLIMDGTKDATRVKEYEKIILKKKTPVSFFSASLAETLRNETKRKCNLKINQMTPRVSVRNDTGPEVELVDMTTNSVDIIDLDAEDDDSISSPASASKKASLSPACGSLSSSESLPDLFTPIISSTTSLAFVSNEDLRETEAPPTQSANEEEAVHESDSDLEDEDEVTPEMEQIKLDTTSRRFVSVIEDDEEEEDDRKSQIELKPRIRNHLMLSPTEKNKKKKKKKKKLIVGRASSPDDNWSVVCGDLSEHDSPSEYDDDDDNYAIEIESEFGGENEPVEDDEYPGIHECEKCGMLMKTAKALRIHNDKKCHTRRILVDIKSNKKKIKIDRSTGKFVCDVCNKLFTTRQTLRRHRHLHTGEISCSKCKKPFNSKTNFRRHRFNVHKLPMFEQHLPGDLALPRFRKGLTRIVDDNKNNCDGELNFCCPFCHEKFRRRFNVQVHILKCHKKKIVKSVKRINWNNED